MDYCQADDVESDEEYVDSVADVNDLEERPDELSQANPHTLPDDSSSRGRVVSNRIGSTPGTGPAGERMGAHVSEQPGHYFARGHQLTPAGVPEKRHTFTYSVCGLY